MAPYLDIDTLINWFQEKKRDLPWREKISPYAVWVSEVMLQQTQVAVVIPYFERWMKRFPTVKDLADASLDEVIKMWEGLGYYSRARNLFQGAKTVCELFGGELPESEEELNLIKGLGPYTIGAIRSFAFHKKATAVDGNVLRVMARLFQVTDDISKGLTVKKIRNLVEESLPDDNHWIVNEALIELGATVCMKKAKCAACPLQRGCLAYRHGLTQEIPFKSSGAATIPLYRAVGVIAQGDSFLVKKGVEEKIMKDLYEFPYFETDKEGVSITELTRKIYDTFDISVNWIQSFDKITHSFTKYRVQLCPELYIAEKRVEVPGYEWRTELELQALAFSSGHRKLLRVINSSFD